MAQWPQQSGYPPPQQQSYGGYGYPEGAQQQQQHQFGSPQQQQQPQRPHQAYTAAGHYGGAGHIAPYGQPVPAQYSQPAAPTALWAPPPEQAANYEALFNEADRDNVGSLAGGTAVTFMRRSGLPDATLRLVWDLADRRGGLLHREEFNVAMRLVVLAQVYGGAHPLSHQLIAGTAHLPLPLPQWAADQTAVPKDSFASLAELASPSPANAAPVAPRSMAPDLAKPSVVSLAQPLPYSNDDDFGTFEAAASHPTVPPPDDFGSFEEASPGATPPMVQDDDEFGDFSHSISVGLPKVDNSAAPPQEDDLFGFDEPAAQPPTMPPASATVPKESTLGEAVLNAPVTYAKKEEKVDLVAQMMAANSGLGDGPKKVSTPFVDMVAADSGDLVQTEGDFDDWTPMTSPAPMSAPSNIDKMAAIDALADLDLSEAIAQNEEWDDFAEGKEDAPSGDAPSATTPDNPFDDFGSASAHDAEFDDFAVAAPPEQGGAGGAENDWGDDPFASDATSAPDFTTSIVESIPSAGGQDDDPFSSLAPEDEATTVAASPGGAFGTQAELSEDDFGDFGEAQKTTGVEDGGLGDFEQASEQVAGNLGGFGDVVKPLEPGVADTREFGDFGQAEPSEFEGGDFGDFDHASDPSTNESDNFGGSGKPSDPVSASAPDKSGDFGGFDQASLFETSSNSKVADEITVTPKSGGDSGEKWVDSAFASEQIQPSGIQEASNLNEDPFASIESETNVATSGEAAAEMGDFTTATDGAEDFNSLTPASDNAPVAEIGLFETAGAYSEDPLSSVSGGAEPDSAFGDSDAGPSPSEMGVEPDFAGGFGAFGEAPEASLGTKKNGFELSNAYEESVQKVGVDDDEDDWGQDAFESAPLESSAEVITADVFSSSTPQADKVDSFASVEGGQGDFGDFGEFGDAVPIDDANGAAFMGFDAPDNFPAPPAGTEAEGTPTSDLSQMGKF